MAPKIRPPDQEYENAKKFMPVTAVIMTTELLENILIHLPMKELLLSQRVCKKWQAVIRQNKDLQRALFLLPEEPTMFWKGQDNGWPPTFTQINRSEYDSITEPDTKAYTVRLNPLFNFQHPEPYMHLSGLDLLDHGLVVEQGVQWNIPSTAESGVTPSWLNMYLTQPPPSGRIRLMIRHTEYGMPATVGDRGRSRAKTLIEDAAGRRRGAVAMSEPGTDGYITEQQEASLINYLILLGREE